MNSGKNVIRIENCKMSRMLQMAYAENVIFENYISKGDEENWNVKLFFRCNDFILDANTVADGSLNEFPSFL